MSLGIQAQRAEDLAARLADGSATNRSYLFEESARRLPPAVVRAMSRSG